MTTEQKLLRATRRILYPLVRILLRNGVSSDAVTELVRQTFVDVADAEFTLPGRKQTTARISVITGLNRKEVARLRGRNPLDQGDRFWWNRAAHVLGSWLRDGDFLDRKGDPLDLPLAGPSPNFGDLVRRHSGDMQPKAVADELKRVGAVEEIDGKLRMTSRGYVPGPEGAAVIDILGLDTAEFIEVVDHNLQAEAGPKLLQRKVLSDNVPAEYVDEFNAYSRRLAQPVIEELARWLSARDKGRDWSGDDERVVLGLGIYQINKPAQRPDSGANAEDSDDDS